VKKQGSGAIFQFNPRPFSENKATKATMNPKDLPIAAKYWGDWAIDRFHERIAFLRETDRVDEKAETPSRIKWGAAQYVNDLIIEQKKNLQPNRKEKQSPARTNKLWKHIQNS
jgi:hypothetical protein